MLNALISGTVGKFGQGFVIKALLIGFVVLGGLVGFLWWQNQSLNRDVGEKDLKIKNLERDVTLAKQSLSDTLQEVKRVDAIVEQGDKRQEKIVTITEYVDREITKTITKTEYVRIALPVEWVCLHDKTVFGLSNIDSTGQPKGIGEFDITQYKCQDSREADAWEVMGIVATNYAVCLSEFNKYKQMSDIVFGFKARQEAYLQNQLK